VERSNRTYVYEKERLRARIIMMREKIKKIYNFLYPIERRVMEDRLNFLESEYYRFDYMINPYHLQPGLLLDIDITSIKRKKATLDAMSNVLSEFLHGVSRGFQDAAFASFSRGRFPTGSGGGARLAVPEAGADSEYLDALNSGEDGDKTAAPKKAGAVDAKPSRRAEAGKTAVD